jgi:hypothetical protein
MRVPAVHLAASPERLAPESTLAARRAGLRGRARAGFQGGGALRVRPAAARRSRCASCSSGQLQNRGQGTQLRRLGHPFALLVSSAQGKARAACRPAMAAALGTPRPAFAPRAPRSARAFASATGAQSAAQCSSWKVRWLSVLSGGRGALVRKPAGRGARVATQVQGSMRGHAAKTRIRPESKIKLRIVTASHGAILRPPDSRSACFWMCPIPEPSGLPYKMGSRSRGERGAASGPLGV